MKIKQFTGPFKANGPALALLFDEETTDAVYLHIGFQLPFRTHFGSILKEEETDSKNEEEVDSKNEEYMKVYIPDESPDFTIKSYSKRIGNRLINGFEQSFRITDRNVLEFDNIADKNWEIKFHKDLPRETIIDIAYE